MTKRIIVTGSAGFIGAHLVNKLFSRDYELLLWDKFSDYYSPEYKKLRVGQLLETFGMTVQNVDLSKADLVRDLLRDFQPTAVIHLAAQPGVRLKHVQYSRYLEDNIVSFQNILSACAENDVPDFVYASSSSVYDDSSTGSFSEKYTSVKPKSFYGMTKKWNEEMARHFSVRYGLRTRGLRFFTVFGPWGRPDMAYFRLIASALGQCEFKLFGDGDVQRDFTFVDDVTLRTEQLLIDLESRERGFYDVVNIGGQDPQSILGLIEAVQEISGQIVTLVYEKANTEDLIRTEADKCYGNTILGNTSYTSLKSGLQQVFEWASQVPIRNQLSKWIDSTI